MLSKNFKGGINERVLHPFSCMLFGVLIISIVVLFHVHCIPQVISGGEDGAVAADAHAHGH